MREAVAGRKVQRIQRAEVHGAEGKYGHLYQREQRDRHLREAGHYCLIWRPEITNHLFIFRDDMLYRGNYPFEHVIFVFVIRISSRGHRCEPKT